MFKGVAKIGLDSEDDLVRIAMRDEALIEHPQLKTADIAARRLLVALVRAPIVSAKGSLNNEATPSIAYAYISATVRKHGHDCVVVDGVAEALNQFWPLENYPGYECQGLTFAEIESRIPDNVDVVGFSGMFSGEWPVLRDLINAMRKGAPQALFVLGGEHATALSEYSLRDCRALDVCVRGEGEATFAALLQAWALNRKIPDDVSGIAYLDGDGNYREGSGLPRIRQIDTIAWPDWPDGYMERFWRAGKSYGVQTERDMPMLLSRGCPYQCTFCSSPSMWTTRYTLRSPDDIIKEIRHYIDRYAITAIQLYDLTAITKKPWTVEFLTKLRDSGIKLNWSLPSGTRSEALDSETISLLRETGCNYLVYAPESGSPDTLKRIKKQIKLEKVEESIRTAKRVGLVVRVNLIIGFPEEKRADVFKTIRWGLKLAALGADEVSINIFSPYPGTELFRKLQAENGMQLNDAYFLSLTSLNSKYTTMKHLVVNKEMHPQEIVIYRIGFMLLNYMLGYILFPARILRTFKVLFRGAHAKTVLEHRLADRLKRG
jgi:anaerobic magnesium-protoporphyrin IX monomethyl ester cyclase